MQQPPVAASKDAKNYLPCMLDSSTQDLIELIFNNDMFNDALKNLEIGTLSAVIILALFCILYIYQSCI